MELGTIERRLAKLSGHLVPLSSPPHPPPPIRRSFTSGEDSYRRIHGQVSENEVTWRAACDELGKDYTDIIYEKAIGEGIAKGLTLITRPMHEPPWIPGPSGPSPHILPSAGPSSIVRPSFDPFIFIVPVTNPTNYLFACAAMDGQQVQPTEGRRRRH